MQYQQRLTIGCKPLETLETVLPKLNCQNSYTDTIKTIILNQINIPKEFIHNHNTVFKEKRCCYSAYFYSILAL